MNEVESDEKGRTNNEMTRENKRKTRENENKEEDMNDNEEKRVLVDSLYSNNPFYIIPLFAVSVSNKLII